MRYWWVNQNQTYDHEINGGYPDLQAGPQHGHQAQLPVGEEEVAPLSAAKAVAPSFRHIPPGSWPRLPSHAIARRDHGEVSGSFPRRAASIARQRIRCRDDVYQIPLWTRRSTSDQVERHGAGRSVRVLGTLTRSGKGRLAGLGQSKCEIFIAPDAGCYLRPIARAATRKALSRWDSRSLASAG